VADATRCGRLRHRKAGRVNVNIPSKLTLMGHTITVHVIAPKDWKHKDCVGLFDPVNHLIAVKKMRPSLMAHVFAHELTHAILSVMSHELYDNEQFVDTFGGLLAQALTTGEPAAPIRRKRKA
jgi:hypothetical protein